MLTAQFIWSSKALNLIKKEEKPLTEKDKELLIRDYALIFAFTYWDGKSE